MFRRRVGHISVPHAFTELGKDAPESLPCERLDRRESVLDPLARHEPPYASPDKREVRCMALEPDVVGSGEQSAPDDVHCDHTSRAARNPCTFSVVDSRRIKMATIHPPVRKYDRSIVDGPIGPAVWRLAWPTMLQNVIAGLQG